VRVCVTRPLPYPNALAQDLLEQCLAAPELRNEVYCQIIKQLTENPSPQSVTKGWQLMRCCLQTFPPSEEFANYLEMFLAAKGKDDKYIEVTRSNLFSVCAAHEYSLLVCVRVVLSSDVARHAVWRQAHVGA